MLLCQLHAPARLQPACPSPPLPPCRYALCSYANCTLLPGSNPPQAACGCYHPDLKGKSLVTANIIKSLQVGGGGLGFGVN